MAERKPADKPAAAKPTASKPAAAKPAPAKPAAAKVAAPAVKPAIAVKAPAPAAKPAPAAVVAKPAPAAVVAKPPVAPVSVAVAKAVVAPAAPAPKPAPAMAAPAPKPAPAMAAPAPANPAPATPAPAKPAPAKPAPDAKPVAKVLAEASGVEANLRAAAGKALDQGRAAYDRIKEAGDEAAEALEASYAASSRGAAELAAKALEAVKSNANATFDHLKALAGSKTLADAFTLHAQFIRTQSETAVAQAKEFAELAKKAAVDASAPLQAQLKKPLSKG